MVVARALLVLLGSLLLSLLPACRCSDSAIIARLDTANGTIERDFAQRLQQWEAAAIGSEFRMGDGVKSGAQSTATLTLTGNAKLSLTPKSVVRFLKDIQEGQLGMDVEVGTANLETGDQELKVLSSVGAVVIEPGTQMRMSRSERGIRFEIAVGSARIDRGAAGVTALDAGRGIEVAVGGAVVEEYAVGEAAVTDAGAVAEAAAEEPAEDPNAEITADTSGNGAQMRAPGGSWQKLAPGTAKLEPGTGVRVTGDSAVTVRRGKQSATLRQGEFLVGAPGGYLVQAVKGPVRLASGGQTAVSVPGGVIIAKGSDTSADVQVDGKKGTSISVHVGEVEVRAKETSTLRGGEDGVLSEAGELSVSGRGPGTADLVVNAGDTFTVHDPRPPTAVGFRMGGACEKGAVAVVGKQQWAGRGGQINVPMPPGRHPYQVKCLEPDGPGKVVAHGNVLILHDAGTAPIAQTAPTSHVNTDGRRYTVLYQNRLPRLTVGWAGAPPASSYTLVVDGRRFTSGSPNHAFGSGELHEGTHTVRFEAATDPPRQSRRTTIHIRFDNATPTASLDPVSAEQVASGSGVTISGRALPGWEVSVDGKPIPLDGQSRFRGKADVPAGQSSLPVKFEHPTRGTHYYLRRPSQ